MTPSETNRRCHCILNVSRAGRLQPHLFSWCMHQDVSKEMFYPSDSGSGHFLCGAPQFRVSFKSLFYCREQPLCWWSELGVLWRQSVWMCVCVCLGWVGLASCCVDMCLWGSELSLGGWHLHCERAHTPTPQAPTLQTPTQFLLTCHPCGSKTWTCPLSPTQAESQRGPT